MEQFTYYSQFLIIGVYGFNTVAYLYLGQWNKVLYWLGATMLCVAVLRMK